MGKFKTWMGKTDTGNTHGVSKNEFVYSMVFTNQSPDTMTLNIFVQRDGNDISLCPKDLQIATGESYVDQNKVFSIGDEVSFTVDKDCDYHFSIEEKE